MEKHVTLVGILNIVYRSLAIIGAIVLFCLAYGFSFLMKFISHFNHNEIQEVPPEVFSIVQIVLTIIGILILIFAVIGIIGAIGVLRKKEWGRITLLIVSFFSLLSIPLGTILGVYSIWVLLNDETIRLFNPVPNTPVKKTAK
ncbi:MAG: hypothetical protein ABSA44_14075 [Bacteroidota bacterium]|jgi:protein-S-isoprenylcysteine O-methyltransferase Ste14